MSLQNSLTWMHHLENHFEDRADYFKFAMVWMSMNSYFSSTYDETQEWERVEHFAQDCESLYQELRKTEMENVIAEFKATGWLQGQPGERNRVSDERDPDNVNKTAIFNDDLDDAKHFLKVLYRIRCNFFHGDKSLHDEGNHRLLAWAYKYANIFWQAFLVENQDN